MLGVLLAAVILYVIAWNVTDVKLDRLVTRFEDAKNGRRRPAQPRPGHARRRARTQICAWSAWWIVRDEAHGREVKGTLRISDNFRDIFGQVKQEPAPAWLVRLGLA